MTRMTETVSGEIHWFKPMAGSARRETYDMARAGEHITMQQIRGLGEYGMTFDCVNPSERFEKDKLYRLVGEWHEFLFYPASQVNRIRAEEYEYAEYRQDDEAETDPDL